jgi:hypothetical protein
MAGSFLFVASGGFDDTTLIRQYRLARIIPPACRSKLGSYELPCLFFSETAFVFEEFGQHLAAFFCEDASVDFASMIETRIGQEMEE